MPCGFSKEKQYHFVGAAESLIAFFTALLLFCASLKYLLKVQVKSCFIFFKDIELCIDLKF